MYMYTRHSHTSSRSSLWYNYKECESYFVILWKYLVLQGYLIGCQLPTHIMRGVVLFCHAHKLLQLTAAHQVTERRVWTEVFLEEQDGQSPDPVHQRHGGRTFLLALAIVRTLELHQCSSVCPSKRKSGSHELHTSQKYIFQTVVCYTMVLPGDLFIMCIMKEV